MSSAKISAMPFASYVILDQLLYVSQLVSSSVNWDNETPLGGSCEDSMK